MFENIRSALNNLKNKLFHKKEILRVRRKNKVRVAFLVIHRSVWKCDRIYKYMEEDGVFDPIVVVCPYTGGNEDQMEEELKRSTNFFVESGYNVINTKLEEDKKWVNVRETVEPDLIFLTNPWPITKEKYRIGNFSDMLTCYVPYFFVVNNKNEENYNKYFHNNVWRAFYETEIHKEIATKYSNNEARNVKITGYPGVDDLIDPNYTAKDVWKVTNSGVKRVIWSPHHTIKGQGAGLRYSNFLEYYRDMLDIAQKYRPRVHFAFKPHPLLRGKLYNRKDWGKVKTDKYYKKWSKMRNTQLEEGGYIDLFLTSDGLIHDCSSFMVEYLCTGNPFLFLNSDNSVNERMNKFGQMAHKMHYQGYGRKDIESFLDKLLSGKDPMKQKRRDFAEKFIQPSGGILPSEKIYRYLRKLLS